MYNKYIKIITLKNGKCKIVNCSKSEIITIKIKEKMNAIRLTLKPYTD